MARRFSIAKLFRHNANNVSYKNLGVRQNWIAGLKSMSLIECLLEDYWFVLPILFSFRALFDLSWVPIFILYFYTRLHEMLGQGFIWKSFTNYASVWPQLRENFHWNLIMICYVFSEDVDVKNYSSKWKWEIIPFICSSKRRT